MLLKIASADQIAIVRDSLKSGHMLLPLPVSLPEGSQILLKLTFPYEHDPALINCVVTSHPSDPRGKSGVIVDFKGEQTLILSIIDKMVFPDGNQSKIEAKPESPKKSSPKPDSKPPRKAKEKPADKKNAGISAESARPPGSGLKFEDIMEMVSSREYEIDLKRDETESTKSIVEKKELTADERQMAEPVARFIMNLTKAMSRSGYYDPNHASSRTAKKGLYEEFLRIAGGFNEIAFACQKTKDVPDIFITGILDSQVNVRTLVGSGLADLFVPKLSEYCDRKQLLSFAIKKNITEDHFNQFIDIMSDPQVDRDEFSKKGAYLTKALIESGITEISTVFMDDILSLEADLPWRVQMAIHRLAKDFKVMPMFRDVTNDSIRKIKILSIQDIIRPLNHPKYFNDFLVNCYIIAENVSEMKPEDIENIIVEAFPLQLLLPTSRYTFEELERIQKIKAEQPDSPTINRRLSGIKRILKMIAGRVAVANVPGVFAFLEQLYQNSILAFKELPVEAQYLVNTRKMASDITANFDRYRDALLKVPSADDAIVYMKCFRRIVPIIIDENNWEAVRDIATLIKKASAIKAISSEFLLNLLKLPSDHTGATTPDVDERNLTKSERLIAYVFGGISEAFITAYEKSDKVRHKLLEEIVDNLGSLGVDMLSRILAKCDDKEVRKHCVISLIKKGELSRKWAIGVLEKPDTPWYLQRNALKILSNVSQNVRDFERIRVHLDHENSKIREEMISLAVSMRPKDVESLIIGALDDADVKVRWRASRALADISPISEAAFIKILSIIKKPLSEDKAESAAQMKKIMNLISAITGLPDLPNKDKFETDIINALNAMIGEEKGLKKFFKRLVVSENEIGMLKAAVPLLGRIGGKESENFLKKLIKSHAQVSNVIQKSLDNIQARNG
jgi:hypothetical protein